MRDWLTPQSPTQRGLALLVFLLSNLHLIMHRIHNAARLPFLYPTCYPHIQRRQMMSAWSYSQDARTKARSTSSELPDQHPVVVPSAQSLSSDSASPQIAARPPPAPRAEKPRPTIKSTKSALSIVRTTPYFDFLTIFSFLVDTRGCITLESDAHRPYTPINSNRRPQQRLCRLVLPPRLRREARQV